MITILNKEKVYVDYPKGCMKNIFKAQEQGDVYEVFTELFKEHRMIMFRSDQAIYLIPNRINSNFKVGDHSIDCLVKKSILQADTDFASTAKILNYVTRLALNGFLSSTAFDHRYIIDKITKVLDENKVNTPYSSPKDKKHNF